MEMVLVLTHLTGSEELDRQRAEEYCRYAAHKGKIPVSPFLCFHGIFKDELGSAVEGILVSRLMEAKVRKMYGEKAQYFSHPEIGKELLVCAMYSEELMERLEDMEGL